jgi:hypothetical protein
MPYEDPLRKKEWERLHRPQRLARRRELRQIEAAWKETHPEALWLRDSGAGLLLPVVVAGGALAAYSPKLAMGAGGLTLFIAATYKKGWRWWIVGALVMLLAFFFLRKDQDVSE